MNITTMCRKEWENFKMLLQNRHINRKGSFMVDMLLALLVGGVIAGVAYNQYDKGRMRTNITNSRNTITLLRTGIQNIYRGQEYEVPTAEVLKASNIMNKEQWRGDKAFNEWSGEIIMGSDNPESFTIEFTLLPQEACMALAQNGNDWLEVNVNGAIEVTESLPYPAAKAASACLPEAKNSVKYTSN